MLPALLFFNLKPIKKIISFLILILIFFLFYIYGNHTINVNQKKFKNIEIKLNVKVVSPNFELEYGLD